jgi:hypothetical protein
MQTITTIGLDIAKSGWRFNARVDGNASRSHCPCARLGH